jgi:hypothetical protein
LTGGFYKSEAANGRSYANQPPETKKKKWFKSCQVKNAQTSSY